MKKSLLFAFAAASFVFAQAATPSLFFKNAKGELEALTQGQTITVGYEESAQDIYQWEAGLYIQADPEMDITCRFKSDASSNGAMMQCCGFDGLCMVGGVDWTEKNGVVSSEDPETLDIHVEYMDLMGTGAPTFETTSTVEVYYDAYPNESLTVYLHTVAQEAAGISTVAIDANAPAAYYNLQGVEVANPTHGNIYVVRQGSKTAKVVY